MGYFNLNSILYNLRKICKYLSFSLLIVAFIVIALLLMEKSVSAFSYETGTYNMQRGYGDESSLYSDRFNLNFVINNNGSVTISGTMGKSYVPDEATFSGYTFNVDFFDSNYAYVFLLRHNYSQGRYLMYKVPRGSTYYAYNNKKYENGNVFNSAFYCSQDYEYWDSTGYIRTYSGGFTDVTNDYSSYCFGCDNYTGSDLSTLIYPLSDTIDEPYISLPNDSTNTFINGEFSQFMVVSNDSIDTVYFHLEANPNVLPVTNRLDLILDENSPYYLNNYTPSDGRKGFFNSEIYITSRLY